VSYLCGRWPEGDANCNNHTCTFELSPAVFSKKTKPGTAISARVLQDVPLPNGMKIRKGTKITGHLIAVQPATHGGGAKLSSVFDRLLVSKAGAPMGTNLRALASPAEAESAHIPTKGACGDTSHFWTITQIGGDVVYRGGEAGRKRPRSCRRAGYRNRWSGGKGRRKTWKSAPGRSRRTPGGRRHYVSSRRTRAAPLDLAT
jgi:hypothetical protein